MDRLRRGIQIPGIELTQGKVHVLVLDVIARVSNLNEIVVATRGDDAALDRRRYAFVRQRTGWGDGSGRRGHRHIDLGAGDTVAPTINQDAMIREQRGILDTRSATRMGNIQSRGRSLPRLLTRHGRC